VTFGAASFSTSVEDSPHEAVTALEASASLRAEMLRRLGVVPE
jgi:hypothetical protein